LAPPPSRGQAKSSGVDLLGLGDTSSSAPTSDQGAFFGSSSSQGQGQVQGQGQSQAQAQGEMAWGAFTGSSQQSQSSQGQGQTDFWSQGQQQQQQQGQGQQQQQQATGPQTLNMMSGHAASSNVRRTPAAPKPVLSESESKDPWKKGANLISLESLSSGIKASSSAGASQGASGGQKISLGNMGAPTSQYSNLRMVNQPQQGMVNPGQYSQGQGQYNPMQMNQGMGMMNQAQYNQMNQMNQGQGQYNQMNQGQGMGGGWL